jgi:glycosyltransferase involved in cell wall biosynthesis
MTPFRVALIEPVGGHGGMNYYDYGLANGLTSVGASVTLYTCDKTVVPEGLTFVVKRYFRGVYGDGPKLLRALRFIVGQLSSLIDARRSGACVAHFHLFGTSIQELFAVVVARALRLSVIVTAHDVESFSGGGSHLVARLVYRFARTVIAHNSVSQHELVEKMQIQPDRIAVVPHGNYIEATGKSRSAPRTEPAKRHMGLPEGRPTILFFGQIKEVKGLDILLHALAQTVRVLPEAHLVVAGRVWKDDFSRYERIIEEHRLKDHVTLHIRYIPDAEATHYFEAADLVVLPYRRIYQSGVLLMAMSHARAVMVSDLPGMTEIVRDGDNGFVFRSGDVAHLASRLSEALADSKRLGEVASRGYDTAAREHDWHRVARLTKQVYQSACRPKHA